jgi:hypothetical protein
MLSSSYFPIHVDFLLGMLLNHRKGGDISFGNVGFEARSVVYQKVELFKVKCVASPKLRVVGNAPYIHNFVTKCFIPVTEFLVFHLLEGTPARDKNRTPVMQVGASRLIDSVTLCAERKFQLVKLLLIKFFDVCDWRNELRFVYPK